MTTGGHAACPPLMMRHRQVPESTRRLMILYVFASSLRTAMTSSRGPDLGHYITTAASFAFPTVGLSVVLPLCCPCHAWPMCDPGMPWQPVPLQAHPSQKRHKGSTRAKPTCTAATAPASRSTQTPALPLTRGLAHLHLGVVERLPRPLGQRGPWGRGAPHPHPRPASPRPWGRPHRPPPESRRDRQLVRVGGVHVRHASCPANPSCTRRKP